MDVREELAMVRNELQNLAEWDMLDVEGITVFNGQRRKKQITDTLVRLDSVLTVMDHMDERLREVAGNRELSEHELSLIALMVKDMIR